MMRAGGGLALRIALGADAQLAHHAAVFVLQDVAVIDESSHLRQAVPSRMPDHRNVLRIARFAAGMVATLAVVGFMAVAHNGNAVRKTKTLSTTVVTPIGTHLPSLFYALASVCARWHDLDSWPGAGQRHCC